MRRLDLRTSGTQLRIAWLLLALIMLVYAVVMGYQSVLRYDTFKATAFDLGNFDQVVWNTLHGRLFQFTNQAIDWYGPPTRLAIHFEPILLPISLLYLIYPDPRTLLVFQTLVLVAGALPVFLLTRRYLPEWPLLATVMTAAYLLMPALLGLNIFDFHPVSLAASFLLYAVLALTYQRYTWFIIACILAASCKEDIPLAVAMLGILVVWKYKLPRLGTLLIVGGLLWAIIAFGVIIPHFFPGHQSNNYWYRYESLGSSPGAAVVNLLFHPWLLFTTFITIERIFYLASLFRSAGFLSLLAPEWLLPALPSLIVNLFSTDDEKLYSGVFHYNAVIVPFVMIAAIHGTRRLIRLWQDWRAEALFEAARSNKDVQEVPAGTAQARAVWYARTLPFQAVLPLLWSRTMFAYQAVAAHPVISRPVMLVQPQVSLFKQRGALRWRIFGERMAPLAKSVPSSRLQWYIYGWIVAMLVLNFIIMTPLLNAFWADHLPGLREQRIQRLLAMIPPDAPVSASQTLNPHLTQRQYVTVFPTITYSTEQGNNNLVEYVIVDLNQLFPEDKAASINTYNQLKRSKQFSIVASAEGVVLLVRRSP